MALDSWSRIPCDIKDLPAIARIVPNLAIEVLSESDTKPEMERKLKEYFANGVELAWIFDPRPRVVPIHRSAGPPDQLVSQADRLEGGTVLPGFSLSLADLFAELERPDGS